MVMKSPRKSIVKTTPITKGGRREGAGRPPDEFKAKCQRLASSPKFFAWAEKVFNGEGVNPKTTIDGRVVLIEASPGDKIYLWEKLAAYGFGKPVEIDPKALIQPLQTLINQNQALRIIQEMNYADRSGTENRDKVVVGNGHTTLSPLTTPDQRL